MDTYRTIGTFLESIKIYIKYNDLKDSTETIKTWNPAHFPFNKVIDLYFIEYLCIGIRDCALSLELPSHPSFLYILLNIYSLQHEVYSILYTESLYDFFNNL